MQSPRFSQEGTSVSRLQVYPWHGPDGLAGGTPHMHTLCTEAYVVTGGEGRVQTVGPEGFAETALTASSVVCRSDPASFTASSTTEICEYLSSCRIRACRKRETP